MPCRIGCRSLYEYYSKHPSRREGLVPFMGPCPWDGMVFANPLLILQRTSLPQGLPVIKIDHLNLRNGLHLRGRQDHSIPINCTVLV